MSSLSGNELYKYHKGDKKDRVPIFLKKYKQEEDFELNNGKKVKFEYDPEVYKLIEKRQPIKGIVLTEKTRSKNKNYYTFKDIKKNSEFGGGGGSRGGADLTAITESGQCYVVSLIYNIKKKSLKLEDLTKENLQAAAKYVDSGTTKLDTILEKSSPEWMNSYIMVANYLYANYKMKSGSKVYVHRDSAFHKKIFSYKSETHKKDKTNDTPQAPGSFDNNKWNPGDIWLTTFGMNASDLPTLPTDSWSSLNRSIYELAGSGSSTSRELLGVSLKKIERNIRCSEYNGPSTQKKKYEFKGFAVSPERLTKGQLPFFSSQDCYLFIGDGKVQFRATASSASSPSWQGEISGSTAAGGKIGGGNVNKYLEDNFGKRMFRNSESELASSVGTDLFWKDFYELYEKLFDNSTFKRYNQNDLGNKLPFAQFKSMAEDRAKTTATYIISKYMCMKMIDIMMSKTSGLDEFSTDLFLYGSSSTDQSSYFLKIYD